MNISVSMSTSATGFDWAARTVKTRGRYSKSIHGWLKQAGLQLYRRHLFGLQGEMPSRFSVAPSHCRSVTPS
jgi:hypothetical protein